MAEPTKPPVENSSKTVAPDPASAPATKVDPAPPVDVKAVADKAIAAPVVADEKPVVVPADKAGDKVVADKAIADKAAADKIAADKVADPDAVPESYALKIGEQEVNPAIVAAITPILKQAGVSAKNAQALAEAYEQAQQALIPMMIEADLAAVKADPELGGLKFVRTERRITDALRQFTTQKERDALTAMGLVNNPTLVRMFHRIGAAMEEAPQTEDSSGRAEKLPSSKKLYGGGDLVKNARTN
jgi:hypothetical protein